MNLDPSEEFSSFFAGIRKSLEACRFTDIHITSGDGYVFSCHRLVLTAASSFLDEELAKNFDENEMITRVALPREIDGSTFKLVLTYMYSGRVYFTISDENVYQLLVVSDILRLKTIKDVCHHYLSQKGVPRESVEQLFRYACYQNDTSLQSTISRFLLNNIHEIISIGSIWPSEFKILLSHFRGTSLIEEAAMVQRILQWTLPLPADDPISRKTAKSHFLRSVKSCSFKYLPLNYPEKYFDNMIPATSMVPETRDRMSWTDFRSSDYRQRFVLHMFSHRPKTPLKLSTLAKNDGAWSSRSLAPLPGGVQEVHKLRCTVVGDRLYWLASRKHPRLDDQNLLTFHSSRSIDISTNSSELSSPFPDFHTPETSLHICSDNNSTIHAFTGDSNILHTYNCELNRWSITNLGDDLFPRAMTWHDGKLYLLAGASPTSQINVLGTLDLRERRFCHVLKEVHSYAAHYECSSHRERLYLASFRGCLSEMIIFDPTAMKGTIMLVPASPTFDEEFRFASYQDALWTIMSSTEGGIRGCIFDPYFQTFKNVPVDGTVLPGSQLMDVVVYSSDD